MILLNTKLLTTMSVLSRPQIRNSVKKSTLTFKIKTKNSQQQLVKLIQPKPSAILLKILEIC